MAPDATSVQRALSANCASSLPPPPRRFERCHDQQTKRLERDARASEQVRGALADGLSGEQQDEEEHRQHGKRHQHGPVGEQTLVGARVAAVTGYDEARARKRQPQHERPEHRVAGERPHRFSQAGSGDFGGIRAGLGCDFRLGVSLGASCRSCLVGKGTAGLSGLLRCSRRQNSPPPPPFVRIVKPTINAIADYCSQFSRRMTRAWHIIFGKGRLDAG